MRSGDTLRRDTLRFALAAIHDEEVARIAAKLDDAAVGDVLRKQAKMRRDSIDAFRKGGRAELVAKEEKELEILLGYLPKQLDEAEIRAIAGRVVAETGAQGQRDMGNVMPKVLAETRDRADGKVVAGIVGALLKERGG